jgi:hypothetical protein
MATLTTSPYSLSYGASVYATLTATNIMGISLVSEAGNGAEILTIPDAPVSLIEVVDQRSVSTLGIEW